MPRGVYLRTERQLKILRNGRKKGQRVAWSLPRTDRQLEASKKNLELTRVERSHSEKEKTAAIRSLKRTHTHKNGNCEICGKECFALQDHCHRTDKLRGKLCHNCNLMLGHAKDNPETLRKAIEYLEKYKAHRFPRLPQRYPRLKEVA